MAFYGELDTGDETFTDYSKKNLAKDRDWSKLPDYASKGFNPPNPPLISPFPSPLTNTSGGGGGGSSKDDYGAKKSSRWDATPYAGGGGGGGGGGGNIAKMKDFTYDKFKSEPFRGEDIKARDFKETIQYNPYTREYDGERFVHSTDPYRGDRFAAPSYEQAMQDPGYQFRLQQGQQALENAAAAKGMLRTGGTMKGLLDYNQASASQEYDKSYGRALGEYRLGYGQEVEANREKYAREAQKFGMNRQSALDEYDRAFQSHQANQGGLARAYGQRMSAHQMNEANRLGARQSNLMKYGQNLAAQQGAWDRSYMGGKDQYDYQLGRASALDSQAAAGSARGRAASNQAYNRARADYLLGYEQDWQENERDWSRFGQLGSTPNVRPRSGG